MSFRNRTLLAGAEGVLRLSVPIVDGRNERQFYKSIKVVPGRWAKEHFRAIVSCYNRSPWFEHYRDELAELFEREYEYLFDWNLACHEWAAAQVKLPAEFKVCTTVEEYESVCVQADENWVNRIRPDKEQKGGGGKTVNGEKGMEAITPYRQVFQEKTGFIAGLSILDLLFCEGPGAVKYLSK